MSVLTVGSFCHKETALTKVVNSCITFNHTGKMETLFSVNGTLENSFCEKMRKNEKSICHSCYVVTLPWYKSLFKKYVVAGILQNVIIPVAEMPFITGYDKGRFNAFSELHNVKEAINFIHFTMKNQHIQFGLWTKRPDLLYKAFLKTGYEKPENLNVVYSDPIINGSANAKKTLEKYYINGVRMIDSVFTVVTLDFAVKNNIHVNCCRPCKECKNSCYTEKHAEMVYELLKCDQKKGIKAGKYN
jgi:hypothetical protein